MNDYDAGCNGELPVTPLTNDLRLHDAGNGFVFFVGKCTRCNGCGYHHGFGEHGHDPDWCGKCGGVGSTTEEAVTPWET